MEKFPINTATKDDLIALKGVGKVLATKIINERTFHSRQDVLSVRGIGPRSLSKILTQHNIELDFRTAEVHSLKFHSVVAGGMKRRDDPAGLGHYGASRGDRDHKGVDVLCTAGEKIFSPINGRVIRVGDPYGNGKFKLLEIKGEQSDSGLFIKLFYCHLLSPDILNKSVSRGDAIGIAESVGAGKANMLDHIHLEVRRTLKGPRFDPTGFVF